MRNDYIRSVDIDGIVEHYWLNFLFIMRIIKKKKKKKRKLKFKSTQHLFQLKYSEY